MATPNMISGKYILEQSPTARFIITAWNVMLDPQSGYQERVNSPITLMVEEFIREGLSDVMNEAELQHRVLGMWISSTMMITAFAQIADIMTMTGQWDSQSSESRIIDQFIIDTNTALIRHVIEAARGYGIDLQQLSEDYPAEDGEFPDG